jgi:predicted methyltransferase
MVTLPKLTPKQQEAFLRIAARLVSVRVKTSGWIKYVDIRDTRGKSMSHFISQLRYHGIISTTNGELHITELGLRYLDYLAEKSKESISG